MTYNANICLNTAEFDDESLIVTSTLVLYVLSSDQYHNRWLNHVRVGHSPTAEHFTIYGAQEHFSPPDLWKYKETQDLKFRNILRSQARAHSPES